MGVIIAFIIRIVGYGLLVGAPARIAQYFWERKGLDHVDVLRAPHDQAVIALFAVTILISLFGYGRLRQPAIFIAFYLAGAALTAPFAFARLAPVAG
jgi:hypothetical protein